MTFVYSIHELADLMWDAEKMYNAYEAMDYYGELNDEAKTEFINTIINEITNRKIEAIEEYMETYNAYDEYAEEGSLIYAITKSLFELKLEIENTEDIQQIMNRLVETIRLTSAGGFKYNNALTELRVIQKNGMKMVRPVFEDGTGENGYYDVNIDCDSGIAAIMDVVNQFVKKMW